MHVTAHIFDCYSFLTNILFVKHIFIPGKRIPKPNDCMKTPLEKGVKSDFLKMRFINYIGKFHVSSSKTPISS